MKILFLDIDGVVNCSTTPQRHEGFIGIDPYMAILVDRIIQATGCKVVLSSSWRHFPTGVAEVKDKVCELLSVTSEIPLDACLDPNKQRGYEIQAWLQTPIHNVQRYAILDDNNDMLNEQQEHFFRTYWEKGLTQEIADKVIAHLNA